MQSWRCHDTGQDHMQKAPKASVPHLSSRGNSPFRVAPSCAFCCGLEGSVPRGKPKRRCCRSCMCRSTSCAPGLVSCDLDQTMKCVFCEYVGQRSLSLETEGVAKSKTTSSCTTSQDSSLKATFNRTKTSAWPSLPSGSSLMAEGS